MADKPKVITTLEEAVEVGYLGTVQDPTPNDAYTVAGVTAAENAAAPPPPVKKKKTGE